jgi:hypothetical protein
MAWSNWLECKFDGNGNLDTSRLQGVPARAGVYAIATKAGGRYSTHYVGRSGRSMRGRLQAHLMGRGNKVIAGVLQNKRARPSDPTQALYVAYLETREHKLVESAYLDAQDRPIANLIRARLPEGLREADVMRSPLED